MKKKSKKMSAAQAQKIAELDAQVLAQAQARREEGGMTAQVKVCFETKLDLGVC